MRSLGLVLRELESQNSRLSLKVHLSIWEAIQLAQDGKFFFSTF